MKSLDQDQLSRFWFFFSSAVPPIGFFLYFKHRVQYPAKAKSALISALLGVPIALLGGHIINTYLLY